MSNIERLRQELERNANDMELRAVLADALDEAGRAFEASNLRKSVTKPVYLRRRRSPIHRRRLSGWESWESFSSRYGVWERWHNHEAFRILCGLWRQDAAQPGVDHSITFKARMLSDVGPLVHNPHRIVRDSS